MEILLVVLYFTIGFGCAVTHQVRSRRDLDATTILVWVFFWPAVAMLCGFIAGVGLFATLYCDFRDKQEAKALEKLKGR